LRDWCTKVALQLLCFLKEKRLFHINFDPNKIYILNQSFNSMPAKPKKEEKRREEREEPPLYGDLPDKLTLRTAKAWRALAARLDKGSLLTEEQWRKNSWTDRPKNLVNYTTMSFDGRVAFGYNNKNFFMTVGSINDVNLYNSGKLLITSKFFSGNFTFGYRFKAKPPTWYKKIQATKLYNMI